MWNAPGNGGTIGFLCVIIVIFLACPILRFYLLRHEKRSTAFLVSDLLFLLFLMQSVASWSMTIFQVVDQDKIQPDMSKEELTQYMLLEGKHLKIDWLVAALVNTELWAIRGCFLALYWSLFSRVSRIWRIALYVAVAFVASTCFINFGLYLGWCHPNWSTWTYPPATKCTPAVTNVAVISIQYATNVTSQIMIMLLPIGLVQTLRLSSSEKFGATLIVMCGFLTLTMSSIRYGIMRALLSEGDALLDYARFQQILDAAELTIVNIAFCLPSFRHVTSEFSWLGKPLLSRTDTQIANPHSSRKELLEISVTREVEVVVSPAHRSELYALGMRGMRDQQAEIFPGGDELAYMGRRPP